MAAVGGAMIAAPMVARAGTTVLDDPQTTPQTVTTDTDSTVTVNTTDDFSVNTNAGNALTISGAGNITYDDGGDNNSLITTGNGGTGLSVFVTGDNPGPPAQAGAITVVSGGTISGDRDGISAVNIGTGSTSVTATGTVTGTNGYGVFALNNTTSMGDVKVSATDVTGGSSGIYAQNNGIGATSITTTGTVTGTNDYGIYALNTNTNGTGGITVSAADVTGGSIGIYIQNNDTGAISITATGTVTGTGDSGIIALNSNANGNGNITVNAADVTGGFNGIYAQNDGLGGISVTTTGTVTGTQSDGIQAFVNNFAATGDITVQAANINAFNDGIFVQNTGLGGANVTATGTITSQNDDGIYVNNINSDGTGDVTINANTITAFGDGIYAENNGAGAINITATGTITTTDTGADGIYAYSNNSGEDKDITINANAINARSDGIVAENYGLGGITITATGTVTATDEEGINVGHYNPLSTGDITINAVDVSGGDYGIEVDNDTLGNVFITSTGTITSVDDGINVDNDNTASSGNVIISANNINSQEDGIIVENNGLGNVGVTATGTVTALDGEGIYIYNSNSGSTGDMTINANTVNATSYGLDVENYGSGRINITATGTVNSQNADGIYAYSDNSSAGNNITINASTINAGEDGIYASNAGLGGINVTATGTVTTLDDDGIDLRISNPDSTADITLNVVNINANDAGIAVENEGQGSIRITATETVSGARNNGIFALNGNQDGAGEIAINANNVSGFYSGIFANNVGLGETNISSTGTVTGASDTGIFAITTNADNTGGLSVNANDVNGNVGGIFALNTGLGETNTSSTGIVTATNGNGISAINGNTDSTGNLSVNANDVNGGSDGIFALNGGRGATSVSSTGSVTGTGNNGISAINDNADNTGGLSVNVNNVTGDIYGIFALNTGLGATSVSSVGTVTGTNDNGIYATALNSANTGGVSVSANNVSGENSGIFAANDGVGNTAVVATGTVSGATGDGILTINTNAAGSGALDVSANNVTGNTNGINVQNIGLGATNVTSTGSSVGTNSNGINAIISNADNAANMNINANNVTGGIDGIHAKSNGRGGISIASTGTVTSIGDDGIEVLNTNAGGAGEIAITVGNVTAFENGIYAENDGRGNTRVAATGTVTSQTADGIFVANTNAAGGNLSVNANNVTGAAFGIFAQNSGTGATSVVSTGTVTGTNNDGIRAINTNAANNSNLTVTANNATGNTNGIFVSNQGTGTINVIANGTVQGKENGVKIESGSTPNPISLTVNSFHTLRNSSNSSASNAISIQGVAGSAATITNNGLIRGNAQLGSENDTFNNNGIWNNAGGTSNFGGGNDTFNNNGAFLAAAATGVSTTTVNGIETVNNAGELVLQNTDARIGGTTAFVGDRLSFTNGGSGVFNADGGVLRVDANIGAQVSDELAVDNLTGRLVVDVNAVDAANLGQPTIGDGVRIVDVSGTSSASGAVLVRPVTGGLYSYELNRGSGGSASFFLQSAVRSEALAGNVLSVLGSRTALATLSNVHDRQRDVGVLPAGQSAQRGVWGRVFGANTEYNSNKAGNLGYDSNTYGAQAGVDLLAATDDKGNRKYGGLYVAYASSNGDVNRGGDKIGSLDLNATTLGAYYSWFSPRKWYFDAVAQYSRLGGTRVKTGGDNISPDGNGYALSVEAGRKMAISEKYAGELQGQLIYQRTDLDDAKLNDGTRLRLSSLSAVTGRLGVRLYGSESATGKFAPWLRANVWHTFNADSTISSRGNQFSIPVGGTSGELELGFSKGNASAGRWAAYGSIGYLFDLGGAEYSGWKGTVGVRKGF